jgi:Bacterial Ig domain
MALSTCPGAAGVELSMSDFFNTADIATPFPNATVASPVHIQATTSNSSLVTAVQVYVDNVLKYQVKGNSVNVDLPMSEGQHDIVVQSWDAAGGIHKCGIYVTVKSEAVVVTHPAPASVVGNSVEVAAIAGGQDAITRMQLYVDGNSQFQSSGNILDTSISLLDGSHTIAVEATDSSGNLLSNQFPVTSARPAVRVLSPVGSASLSSPVYISATTVDPTPVTAVQIYVDNKLVYQVSGTGVQATLPLSTGKHLLVVQAWNSSGATYKQALTVNIQ